MKAPQGVLKYQMRSPRLGSPAVFDRLTEHGPTVGRDGRPGGFQVVHEERQVRRADVGGGGQLPVLAGGADGEQLDVEVRPQPQHGDLDLVDLGPGGRLVERSHPPQQVGPQRLPCKTRWPGPCPVR